MFNFIVLYYIIATGFLIAFLTGILVLKVTIKDNIELDLSDDIINTFYIMWSILWPIAIIKILKEEEQNNENFKR